MNAIIKRGAVTVSLKIDKAVILAILLILR